VCLQITSGGMEILLDDCFAAPQEAEEGLLTFLKLSLESHNLRLQSLHSPQNNFPSLILGRFPENRVERHFRQ
jgi:hypothetical protein